MPFVSLRSKTAKDITTKLPITNMMNVGPNPNDKITTLPDHNPIMPLSAPIKLLNLHQYLFNQ